MGNRAPYGSGSIFRRGEIGYVSHWVDGKQRVKSSKSRKIQDAKRLPRLRGRVSLKSRTDS